MNYCIGTRWLRVFSTVLMLSACAGPQTLKLEGTFPVPLIEKAPVNLGIQLDEALTNYTYKETIDKKGTWEVSLGASQKALFTKLGTGVFEGFQFVDSTTVAPPLDGVLKPVIDEVQFALPSQTRSDYYEVWIRYDFKLYDRAGTPVGTWKLPAYGKANINNYGNKSNGLQAAAMAACRDAMAFFSLNFSREPAVQKWIAAGKPLLPPPAVADPGTTPAAPGSQTPAAAPAGDPSTATEPSAAAQGNAT